jgi:hypothetical protein
LAITLPRSASIFCWKQILRLKAKYINKEKEIQEKRNMKVEKHKKGGLNCVLEI